MGGRRVGRPTYRDSAAAGYAEARRREARGSKAQRMGHRSSMDAIDDGMAKARRALAAVAFAALTTTVLLALYGAVSIIRHGF